MLLSTVETAYQRHELDRLHQGDILRDFKIVEWASEKDGELLIQERLLPYSVTLTQDCDLEQDHKNFSDEDRKSDDKILQSILLCPAYPAEDFRQGNHLEELSLKMQSHSSNLWRQIKQNNNLRYHYLQGYSKLQVPDVVIDFKHYFTVPREIIYTCDLNDYYIATIVELFRENLSQRFAQYLSRIGLPIIEALN